MPFSLIIDDQKFDEIFPFSFIINGDLEIIKAGKSLIKLFPQFVGRHFTELFAIERPRFATPDIHSFLGLTNQIIILKSTSDDKLLFRYGMVSLNDGKEILFAGSPWVTKADMLKSFGLKLNDFALHDAITDLLQVLTVKDIALTEVRKLNEAVEKSERKYRQVVENAHDLIYYLDPNGYFTYVNKVAVEKLELPYSQIVGKHFTDMIDDSYKEEVTRFYIKAREEKLDKTYFEFPIISSSGNIIWLGQNVQADKDEAGEILSFFSVARDITEQKGLEENLRSAELRLRKLISNLQSGILVENENRNIVLANQKFCDIFHIPVDPQQLIGMDCSNSAEEAKGLFEDPHGFVGDIEAALKGQQAVVGHELTMTSGRIFERDYIPIFFKEKYLGHLWQYRDITDSKQAEQKLIEARQLAEAAQEAEKQFLAKMSHEIRTPLNAVVGMSHLLSETRTTAEQREYLEILSSSADLLQNLISDILDLSKITAGQVEVVNGPVNLPKVIDSLYNSFRLKCAEKDVALVLHFDPVVIPNVIGDELLINQILINLVSNAVKFTNEGTITIGVTLQDKIKDTQAIEFSVRDTGIGISEKNLDNIFENFKQAHAEISRQYGGTGLGLAIVTQLVSLLGGSINVTSEFGTGSSFTVQLPLKIDSSNTSQQKLLQPEGEVSLDNLKILIAEDNVMNRKYIGRLFEKWNIAFDMVFNGQEALEIVKANNYDLIFMDIQMPVMNGYETTRAIRNLEGNANQSIPIIALTASALTEHKHLAEDMGMNGFISKPFRPDQLKQKLREYAQIIDAGNSSSLYKIEELDRAHLETMYGDDTEYAKEMFELFVDHIYQEYQMLRGHIEASDVESARALLHKITPSFSMVGLNTLGEKFTDYKEMIKTSFEREKALMMLEELNDEFEASVPLVKEEITRLTS